MKKIWKIVKRVVNYIINQKDVKKEAGNNRPRKQNELK